MSAREVKKAEEVLERVRRLEVSEAAPGAFRATDRKHLKKLLSKAEGLPEGDIRTDLLTALLLGEAAAEAARRNAAAPDCEREARDVYRKLCLESPSADRAQFLRAKARLHTRWAASALRHLRGARDAETLDTLAEVRAARDFDAALAARAAAALRSLATLASAFAPRLDEEGQTTQAGNSTRQLAEEVARALDTVDAALASLPRGRLYDLLRNARNAYRDALHWGGKTMRTRSLVVSANSLAARDEMEEMRLNPLAVEQAAAGNRLSAERFMKRAETLIEEEARRAGPAPSPASASTDSSIRHTR